jgi:hypothetical protein
MNSTKKTTQKTSGIHKIKLGQLVTLNGHVYQCIKYRLNCCKIDEHVYRITKASEPPTCKHCVNYKRWPNRCRYFGCWGHVPVNCYFKLVK